MKLANIIGSVNGPDQTGPFAISNITYIFGLQHFLDNDSEDTGQQEHANNGHYHNEQLFIGTKATFPRFGALVTLVIRMVL